MKENTVKLFFENRLSGERLQDFFKLRKGYGFGLGVRTHILPNESGSKSPIGEFGWDGAAGGFTMVDPVNNISMTYLQHVFNWKVEMQNTLRNALYDDLLLGKKISCAL